MTPGSSDASQDPEDLYASSILFTGLGVGSSADGQRAGTGRHGGGTARKLLRREGAPKPRSGWYAYRVTGPATLPSWAVEVALSVERPVEPHPMQRFAGQDDQAVSPRPPEPGASDGATFPAAGSAAQAVVLLRAPARMSWLADVAEAAMEVEAAAGIRRGANTDTSIGNIARTPTRWQVGTRTRWRLGTWSRLPGGTRSPSLAGTWSRLLGGTRSLSLVRMRPDLLMGPPLPGLVPISAAAAELHLATAGARGLPAPLRRWTPAAGGKDQAWQAGAGCVLTCDGPDGVSAQAVVALGGAGDPEAITPPPGGALVLRAWRAKHTWGAACALVLGASEAAGLGREAGRVASRARGAGWDAIALQGATAMEMARAGDHRAVAPEVAARARSGRQVARLLEACLAAADRDGRAPGPGSMWTLAVTP